MLLLHIPSSNKRSIFLQHKLLSHTTSELTTHTLDLPENIKLYIRSYTISEYIARFHNLNEDTPRRLDIYDFETKLCALFNDFVGKNDIKVKLMTEMSLFTTKEQSEVKKNELDPKAKTATRNDGKITLFLSEAIKQ